MSIIDYSSNWKDSTDILIYISPDFTYSKCIILTEFDNCLIKPLPKTAIYHKINPRDVTFYSEEYIEELKKSSCEYSIVILSNQMHSEKLIYDMIKRKFEMFLSKINIPVIAIFATRPNYLSKPHTGMWKLLKRLYKNKNFIIEKACYISNNSGTIFEKETKNNVKLIYDKTDLDRVFAFNINVPFYTIEEYLNPNYTAKYEWNKTYLSPTDLQLYIENTKKYVNPSIINSIFNKPNAAITQLHMIFIMGYPRCGKTTFCKNFIKDWNNSEFGATRAIVCLSKKGKTRLHLVKKNFEKYISVLIDGECYTDALRSPYIKIAKEYGAMLHCVNVDPGINVTMAFNHLAVENTTDSTLEVYDIKNYRIYSSISKKPTSVILYRPDIINEHVLYKYRWTEVK